MRAEVGCGGTCFRNKLILSLPTAVLQSLIRVTPSDSLTPVSIKKKFWEFFFVTQPFNLQLCCP